MAQFNAVTKTEFDAFIAAYPRKLARDVAGMYDPPLITYNDFERAPYWPDSIIASHKAYTSYEDDAPTGFQVIADVGSPVEDDGKRDAEKPLIDKNGREVKDGDRIRAHWGGSYSAETGHVPNFREHTVLIRDKGTKYERWSMDDCHNNLRGFVFEVIPA